MWSWLKALWNDETRFTGAAVFAMGSIGTAVPLVAALNLPDFHVPGVWVAAAACCNVFALGLGYRATPGGQR